jgi:hypothetical protein
MSDVTGNQGPKGSQRASIEESGVHSWTMRVTYVREVGAVRATIYGFAVKRRFAMVLQLG